MNLVIGVDLDALRRRGDGNRYGFFSAGDWSFAAGAPHTIQVPYPAGLKQDDILCIHMVIIPFSGAPTITPPAGWTVEVAQSMNGSSYRAVMIWKRATGSESGTVGVVISGSTGATTASRAIMTAFGGCVTTGNPFVDLKNATAQTANAIASSITTSAADQYVVNLVAHDAQDVTQTPPAGYTELYDRATNDIGLDSGIGLNYKLYASAGATGTQTTNLSASRRWVVTTFGLLKA